jgi:hypothetical protein
MGEDSRRVTGTLTGSDAWENVIVSIRPVASQRRLPAANENASAQARLRASEIGARFTEATLKPAADGSFETSNLLPGWYELVVSIPGVPDYAAATTFTTQRDGTGGMITINLGEIPVSNQGGARPIDPLPRPPGRGGGSRRGG